MNTLALLVGIWATICTQTQIDGRSGFVKETYEIAENASYTFTRDWYSDASCSEHAGESVESGTLKVGGKLSTWGFNSGDTYEVDFTSNGKTDLGAVKVKANALNFARGNGWNGRNTMVGFFDYVKQN